MVTRDIRPLVLLLLSEKSHVASLLLACKRARDAPTCYQLFSVSGGRVLCLFLLQVENAGGCRSVGRRGNIKFTEQIHNVKFNLCIVRPSNARFVIFCTFKVADAAGAATLRFKR